jgi:serine/threonine-protein kinase
MGQVWRANDQILGRPVAVKLLRSEYAEDPEFVDRFRAEARRTAALSHPGIASVFDYGETGDPDDQGTTAYLVMELVEGEPLSALLSREGRLSPAHTLDVLAQAALALDSAHLAGVVHRDVKPSNLLLRRDGVVKVTDFGIAHAADEAPRTEAGLVVGTAAYLSPEQVACRPATPASDVYALGVVAYECLAGRRPFTGEHPIALALAHRRDDPPPLPEDVPEAVCELVSWTMSKAPSARPHSAGALGRQALVARTSLDGQDDEGGLQTPAGGWFPVMSGWHPALGRDPAEQGSAAGRTADPNRNGAAPAAPAKGPGDAGKGAAATRRRGDASAGAAATGRPAGTPARAEREVAAGHQPRANGTTPTRAHGPTGAAPPDATAGPASAPRGTGGAPDAEPRGTAGAPVAGQPRTTPGDTAPGRAAPSHSALANGSGEGDQRVPANGSGRHAPGRADRSQRDPALEATGEWAPSPLVDERGAGAPDAVVPARPAGRKLAAEPAAPAPPVTGRPPAERPGAEQPAGGAAATSRGSGTGSVQDRPVRGSGAGALPGRAARVAPVARVAAVQIATLGTTGVPELRRRGGRRRAERQRGSVVTAVVVITALLAAGVMAAARQRSYAVVPSVDGQQLTAAGQALTRAGFEVREEMQPNATVRAGVVISQQPSAGVRRTKGTPVTMVVSSGPPVVVLNPAGYLGRPLGQVRAAMIQLGLQVSVTGTLGRTGSGRVIGINPSGTLHQGDEVTVTVASRRLAAGA